MTKSEIFFFYENQFISLKQNLPGTLYYQSIDKESEKFFFIFNIMCASNKEILFGKIRIKKN